MQQAIEVTRQKLWSKNALAFAVTQRPPHENVFDRKSTAAAAFTPVPLPTARLPALRGVDKTTARHRSPDELDADASPSPQPSAARRFACRSHLASQRRHLHHQPARGRLSGTHCPDREADTRHAPHRRTRVETSLQDIRDSCGNCPKNTAGRSGAQRCWTLPQGPFSISTVPLRGMDLLNRASQRKRPWPATAAPKAAERALCRCHLSGSLLMKGGSYRQDNLPRN